MSDKIQYTVHEHLVPVCYLKLFANKENSKIHRYHKKNGDIKFEAPSNVAYEDDFYEIYKENDGEKEYIARNVIENAFGIIESNFQKHWFKAIQYMDINNIEEKEFEILCNFISVQFARTKKQHIVMQDILSMFVPGIHKHSNANQKLALQNALFAYKKDDSIKGPVSLRDMIYNWLFNCGCFMFLENNNANHFYTCDNPVLLFNESHDTMQIDALYIPLSSTFALFVIDENIIDNKGRISKLKISDIGVQFLNGLICDNADKYIITDEFSDNDISFLKSHDYNITYIKY